MCRRQIVEHENLHGQISTLTHKASDLEALFNKTQTIEEIRWRGMKRRELLEGYLKPPCGVNLAMLKTRRYKFDSYHIWVTVFGWPRITAATW